MIFLPIHSKGKRDNGLDQDLIIKKLFKLSNTIYIL
jgi:hypothetical protein